MSASPAPSRKLAEVVALLLEYGFRVQTSTDVYRGARDMWALGPAGVGGPFAVFRVAAKSGRVTGVECRPGGEDRPVREVPRGDSGGWMAACFLRDAVEAAMSPEERVERRVEALRSVG